MSIRLPTSIIKPCLPPANSLLSANRAIDSLSKSGRLDDARRLFDQMPHRDDFTWNTLIAAYARSGLLPAAEHLFRSAPHRDSSFVPWSSLISGLSRHGRPSDALLLFRRMLASGLPADPYSLGGALRACSELSHLRSGEQAHAQVIKYALASDSFVSAGVVDMYAKCGRLADAARAFDSVPAGGLDNRVLWTAMVSGHAKNGDATGAMDVYRRMRAAGVSPNHFTLPGVLQACAVETALGLGRQVHGYAVRAGYESFPFVQSSLVGMYAKCSDTVSARRLLEATSSGDVVPWNTLIVCCSRAALHHETLSLFVEMHERTLALDEFTYPSALNSAAANGDEFTGTAVHCLLVKSGFQAHQHIGNALIDMYAKCGRFNLARIVFDDMPDRDVVAWTAVLTGLARHGAHEDALRLYSEMRAWEITPDEIVVSAVLSSCAELPVLELGRQVHATSISSGLTSSISISNSLTSMYAKTGCIKEAASVFHSTEPNRRDAITWTAMLVGYAQNGRGRDSLRLYQQMVSHGCNPDYVTFIGVLFACSHTGLVEEGRAHFESMETRYGVTPGTDHYACMIDLYGRAGRTAEAARLVETLGAAADAAVWKALLGACRVHKDVHLAEEAAARAAELDSGDAVPYVMLANVYSSAGRWKEVARVRGAMRARGVSKEPGCSWVEAATGVHVFGANPRSEEVRRKVEEMMGRVAEEGGYVAETGWSLQDLGEEGKERGLWCHSERLAVAFGLMTVPEGAVVRVYKNLRVCGDCHKVIKMVARVYGREIVLRDANCFHHFGTGGECSCGDYW